LPVFDTLAAIRAGRRPAPVSVEFDLSNRCSLGCEWCHFAYTHTRGPLAKGPKLEDRIPGGDLIDTVLAKNIIEQLADAGVKSIIWTGGGEPTLHPDFDEIISHTARQSYHLRQGMYTNGAHIDSARATLIRENFTWVNISLDAVTPSEYQEVKRVPAFVKVCQNTERLAQTPGGAVLGVSFLVTEGNADKIVDMVSLGRRLGADYTYLRPTILYDQATPAELAEDTEWIDDALPMLEVFQGEPDVIVDTDRFHMYRDWNGHGYSMCHWSALQTVITPNGKMWTCVNKREHPAALLGDLSQEDFITVWSRNDVPAVDGACRVMCRGHLANQTLQRVMERPAHAEFI
jgi:MoaA/NifB/PqqE/SkfB family radical SAM enzyme